MFIVGHAEAVMPWACGGQLPLPVQTDLKYTTMVLHRHHITPSMASEMPAHDSRLWLVCHSNGINGQHVCLRDRQTSTRCSARELNLVVTVT